MKNFLRGVLEDTMKKTNPDSARTTGSTARLSDERYRAFIENINDGVYEMDIHGNFIYFNQALCKIFGYSREELQWQNFSRFMDEKQASAAFDVLKRIERTKLEVSEIIWRILDEEGNTRIIELSASLIVNSQGKAIGFRGIARDVTERFRTQEALRESERRYRTLLDFVPYPMVLFTAEGKVSYLNPAFTETFGWTLAELEGKTIPYIPPGLEQEARESVKKFFKDRGLKRYETKRVRKDGRVLHVVMRAAFLSEKDVGAGELVILRDMTEEKRIARNNEAMLRISMALPEYPDLEDLLEFVSNEVKRLLGTEGAVVILRDEGSDELFFLGAAYDDEVIQERVKEMRFPLDRLVAGEVIKTGKPMIVADPSRDSELSRERDKILGYHTRNLLLVPLRSSDRIIGALCAINKKEGEFDETGVELLNMIAGTVVLSLENARFSEELKKAYKEVTSLNKAKDRVINHLSHELKTPCAVLAASLSILERRLESLPDDTWRQTVVRAKRNLERLLEIQYQVEDIMRDPHYEAYHILSLLVDECADELEALVAERTEEGSLTDQIRKRVDAIFGPKERVGQEIFLDQFIRERLVEIKKVAAHRKLEIKSHMETTPSICMPVDELRKVVDGLMRNAIENTPDEGKIEVSVQKRGSGVELQVRDRGVGITEENQRRIFEGFFTTRETMDYSSKRPFDFNAGGKGGDLLRMKIFSERYGYKIGMESSRCCFIPEETDMCPGRISRCRFCSKKEDCFGSGESTFKVFFPPASASSVPCEQRF